MRRNQPSRKMRQFSKLSEKYVPRNYMKYLKLAMRDMQENHDITNNELKILLFFYDYEFFTLDHAAEAIHQSRKRFAERILYPMQKKGLVTQVHKRWSVETGSDVDMFFASESKHNYKVRYGVSQRGRLLVQRFYRKMEGDETIKVSS